MNGILYPSNPRFDRLGYRVAIIWIELSGEELLFFFFFFSDEGFISNEISLDELGVVFDLFSLREQ